MKKVVSRSRLIACRPLERWCRQLSSLRGAVERRKTDYRDLAQSRTKEVSSLDPQYAGVGSQLRPGNPVGGYGGWIGPVAKDGRSCSRLLKEGELSEAVKALDLLVQQGSNVSTPLFYRVLKRCISQRDVVLGRRVHALIRHIGYESDPFLANHTICMYASNGMLEEATEVFTKVGRPDIYMWASIILAHARHGQAGQAIELYKQMRDSTVQPDNHTFVAVLKACAGAADLAFGKEVHADILSALAEPDMFVRSCLVEMYAKCGSLEDARRVFDSMPTKSVVTWTSMIAGYAQHGLGEEALTLHASMQQEGISVADDVTLSCLLKACASARALQQGCKQEM